MIFLNNLNSFTYSEMEKVYESNSLFWIILIFVCFLSALVLIFWIHRMKKEYTEGSNKYLLNDIQTNDWEVMNYFMTYLFPILSLDITSWPSIFMNLILIISVGIFFIRNNTLHYNVMLILLGFHVYTDSNKNVIISKSTISEIKNHALEADQIGTSNIFYIE